MNSNLTSAKETKKLPVFWQGIKENVQNEYSHWRTFYNSLPMRLLRNASRIAGYVLMIVLLVYPEARPVVRHYADVLIAYLLGTHSVPTGFAIRCTYLVWQQMVFPVRWLAGLLPF